MTLGLVDQLFKRLLGETMHQLPRFRGNVRLGVSVVNSLNMNLQPINNDRRTISFGTQLRTTGVSNSYRSFHCC